MAGMPKILRVLVAASVLKGAVAVAAAPLSRDPAPAPPPPATVETLPAEMDFYEDTYEDAAQFETAESCPPVYYVEADYLFWQVQGADTPPLVTTSTPGTPQPQAGVLGQPNTSILYGDERLNNDGRSGARIVLGRRLTSCAKVEGEWFMLSESQEEFHQDSTGNPILARPFTNIAGVQEAFLVAYPGVRQGEINVNSTNNFSGATIAVVEEWNPDCDHRAGQLSLAMGLRYLRLADNLEISDALVSIDPAGPVPVGTQFSTFDQFETTNDFFGLNLGLRSEWQRERWCFTAAGNLGIGQTIRHVTINGRSSTTTPAGATTNFDGGLLALPTNMGHYRNTELGFVPQIQFKLAYEITCNARIIVGYDAMWWSSVARPGDQIDTTVNTSQTSGQPLVGAAAPVFNFNESVLWVQGVSVGGEWRF
jgi:hypothetical protein